MKLTDIELLAALENLRIKYENDKYADADFVLRVASAIVAKNCGYNSRADWTKIVRNSGLVDYDVAPTGRTLSLQEMAEVNYKKLMDKLDSPDTKQEGKCDG